MIDNNNFMDHLYQNSGKFAFLSIVIVWSDDSIYDMQ